MRFGRDESALTEADCRALLGGIDPEIAGELAGAMLSGCAPRYGHGATAPRASDDRVAELLRTIDREVD